MTNIALLFGDIIIYWNQIISVLGILAGFILAFVLRPFTKVKKSAVVIWFVLAAIFSAVLARLLYFYCNIEQYVSIKAALTDFSDTGFCAAGVVCGVLLAAWIVRLCRLVKSTGRLLDTVFPGVVLALGLIRLSYLFTDTYHSRLTVGYFLFERPPFAVQVTDAAGNVSWVFAPFMVSFLIFFITAFVAVLIVRKKVRHPGDLFLVTFVIFLLTEMVLEGTRNDPLKLHFILLDQLNKYVSFISFSMLLCAVFLLLVFVVNYIKLVRHGGRKKTGIWLVLFLLGLVCFGICEYLVQRYTAMGVVFHLTQTGAAILMGIASIAVVMLKNRRKTQKKKKEPEPADEEQPQNEEIATESN